MVRTGESNANSKIDFRIHASNATNRRPSECECECECCECWGRVSEYWSETETGREGDGEREGEDERENSKGEAEGRGGIEK